MTEAVSATFTTLFERSRYSSQGPRFGIDEELREKRNKQQERFAVGMIGFTLGHDDKFKAHFLESVCGLKDVPRAGCWEVLVEPESWGDLVLKHRDSSSLVVVEFKIDANLQKP